MHRPLYRTRLYVALLFATIATPALGQGSIYDELLDSREQAGTPLPENMVEAVPVPLDQPSTETFLAPTMDVTAGGIVSTIPATPWKIDLELVAFRPKFGNFDFTEDGEDKFYATPRITLAWESESGRGVRGRVWGYEAETEFSIPEPFSAGGFGMTRGFDFRDASQTGPATSVFTTDYFLRTGSLDIDFYKHFSRDQTSFVYGAGLKSASLQVEIPGLSDNSQLGIGLGLFSDVRHMIYRTEHSELALVGSGRIGFVTGEWENNSYYVVVQSGLTQQMTIVREEDADMVISEASLGLEWQRDLGWSVLTLRAQYETQHWNTDVTDDVTFNGGVVKAGLDW